MLMLRGILCPIGQNNTKGISGLEQELNCAKLILVSRVHSNDKWYVSRS